MTTSQQVLKQLESYTVYSLVGSEVKSGITEIGSVIDVSDLPNGVYIISKPSGSIKVVKQ